MTSQLAPCPTWCTEPYGHEHDSITADGIPVRNHFREFGDVTTVDSGGVVVAILAPEYTTPGQPPITEPAAVMVDTLLLDAEGAEHLSALLLEAAAVLRGTTADHNGGR
ncbi:DUF6907 domain-containing protein [Propionibacteriaceae bacterium Y1685]